MAGEPGPDQWPRWTAVLALGVLGVLLLSTVADVVLNVRRPGDLVPSPGPAVAPPGRRAGECRRRRLGADLAAPTPPILVASSAGSSR